MARPSHLEMAGWGLASMLGACVLAYKLNTIGLPAFFVGLSFATWRAEKSIRPGFRSLLLLHFFVFFVLTTMPRLFEIDTRLEIPITAPALPALYMRSNPAPGSVRITLYLASVWCALWCAVAARTVMDRKMIPSIVRAMIVFASTMALHLYVVTNWVRWEPHDAHYSKMLSGALISLYSLMPVYAGYFVALFWDVSTDKSIEPKN